MITITRTAEINGHAIAVTVEYGGNYGLGYHAYYIVDGRQVNEVDAARCDADRRLGTRTLDEIATAHADTEIANAISDQAVRDAEASGLSSFLADAGIEMPDASMPTASRIWSVASEDGFVQGRNLVGIANDVCNHTAMSVRHALSLLAAGRL